MISSRRFAPAVVTAVLVLASCGGSDAADETPATDAPIVTTPEDAGDEFTEVDGATDTEEVDTEEVDTDTEVESDETPEAEVDETSEPAEPGVVTEVSAASGAQVALVEWAIEAPNEYAAGELTFSATNNGSFPHELVVIQGEGYESLPREEGGAVIEADLPTGALIGRTARLGGGSAEDLTVTLAPGNYVLVCNLGGGANSHAGQGQRLDITVS